jgi:pimeloyl-ACP methyl ester carboxylesterase
MGGIVITQTAARCPERIALLVYVCAFLPADGQSLLDLTQLPEGADDQIQANLVVEGDPPVARLYPEATKQAIYNCCSDEQAAWAAERRRPQALAVFTTPVELGDAEPPPRAYVICTRDNSIPPALQRRMVRERPCADVVELDTDHAPYLSRTRELAGALERFARQAA